MTTDTTTIVWRRDARGIVQSLEIHRGDELLLDTAASDNPDDTLGHVLRLARDYYRCDTGDDTLPPDHAVIAAYEEHIA
jgi:hypothetical protein